MAFTDDGQWVDDSEWDGTTVNNTSGVPGPIAGFDNWFSDPRHGDIYNVFMGQDRFDPSGGWSQDPLNLYPGSDRPAWMSYIGRDYSDPEVGGPSGMAGKAYHMYRAGNEGRVPTAQDIGHGIFGRVIENKPWDQLWPVAGGGTPTGNDYEELRFDPADWESFNRWAHEGAPTGGLVRTGHYDASRFSGPVTKDSPLWESGGFVGGDRYEPTIGSGNMLNWSDFTPGVGQKTPLFLEGGPVDTGAIRGGFTPTTPEQQTEGQRWLDQLTDAYETYQGTPYATFASTGTSPNLEGNQHAWNVLANMYNRRVMKARNQSNIDDTTDDTIIDDTIIDDTIIDDTTDDITNGDTRNPGVPGSSTHIRYPNYQGPQSTGDITSATDSIPAVDPNVQQFFTHDVGNDPLSQIANLALTDVISTGGVAATPFTAQTEGALSDIIANQGYLPPTDYEQDLQQQYQGVVDEGGVQPLTDLERETQANLWELINRGGQIPLDEQRRAMQIESARSPIDALRRAQLSQGQAAMAGRGTLGQGPETAYMQRVESQLAPMYAQAAQSIALEEAQAADQRYQTALQQLNQQALQGRISADQHAQQARELQSAMAMDIARRQDDRLMTAIQTSADLTTAQSANLVDAVNAMTGVQQMRTDSAIKVLEQNRLWNQFLAEYGLDRAKTMNDLQTGRYLHLMPMIQQFMNMLQISTGGFVGQ
tara:strand:+ start:10545 stop:12656 length:2112 start_codon:yes stop_codon:yes gene_type:complete